MSLGRRLTAEGLGTAFLLSAVVGAFAGVVAAHLMFDEPLSAASTKIRAGPAQVFSEFVATFGLIAVPGQRPTRSRESGRRT